MTTEQETITETKTTTETLTTCDFCDLTEADLDAGETIETIEVNPKVQFDPPHGDGSYIGSFGHHEVWPRDDSFHLDSSEIGRASVRMVSHGQIDFCTHCLETLFEE